jgi:hypothetical protein
MRSAIPQFANRAARHGDCRFQSIVGQPCKLRRNEFSVATVDCNNHARILRVADHYRGVSNCLGNWAEDSASTEVRFDWRSPSRTCSLPDHQRTLIRLMNRINDGRDPSWRRIRLAIQATQAQCLKHVEAAATRMTIDEQASVAVAHAQARVEIAAHAAVADDWATT